MNNKDQRLWISHYSVHTSDTDYRSKGKLSFLLDIMQRAADSAVSGLGLSLEKMLEAGMGWMLITLDLQLKQMPRPNDLLAVYTWSKGTKGAMWQRDYRIFDSNKVEIASARSIWVLVDIAERKILRPSALPVKVTHYDGDSVGGIPEKLRVPPQLPMEEAYPYKVRYSGLDNNGHLNNARYGDLCSDVLTLEEWEQMEPRRFRISYMQEAIFDEAIQIMRSQMTPEGIFIRGQNDEKVFFEACVELGLEKEPE
ncbi:acyl-ACP thioesterase [Paenibacillus albidus]|uniref:acyl-[acyl-carrier-protein] thioesterase n=1 Tax=Paenibacillus albidus TaxID=2041023 RepID=UPI001BEC3B32|nr:acyl-ACP thioesterase domain-containing protein [Paenibacillus albidus]MBT2289140.1 acyl-ACP thioesterase [Paenibacillus albidus]